MRRALVLVLVGLLIGLVYGLLRSGSPRSPSHTPAAATTAEGPRSATCSQLASDARLSLRFLHQAAVRSNNELYTLTELEHIARGTALILCAGSRNSAFRPWAQVLSSTRHADGYLPGDPALRGAVRPL